MTQLQEIRAALAEAVDDPAFVDAMILQIQRQTLPVRAPIAGYVRRDTTRAKTHRERMAEGSTELAEAIAAMRRGDTPDTADEPIWRVPFQGGGTDHGQYVHKEPVYAARHPCVKCGVREDQHRLHGCRSYMAGAL